jgi:hypothetical protein
VSQPGTEAGKHLLPLHDWLPSFMHGIQLGAITMHQCGFWGVVLLLDDEEGCGHVFLFLSCMQVYISPLHQR